MKVCIIGNAEAEYNAITLRMIDALLESNHQPITLSRLRDEVKDEGEIVQKTIELNGQKIPNFEIQLSSERGKGLSNLWNLFRYQLKVFSWLFKNREKYETIHSFDLDTGLPSMIIVKLFNKKMVYHIADFYADSRKGIPHKLRDIIVNLEYRVISKADVTLICTEDRKEQIKGSNPNELHVIHNSPLIELETSQIHEFEKKPLKLCYVGTFTDVRFIKEILNVVKSNPDLQLDIAGYGPLEVQVKAISDEAININYHGKVGYEEAIDLYQNCDVMFAIYDPSHPNHRYSAPNKVYEAMMLGKPIFVANGTGVDELVRNEDIGFTIDYTEEDFTKKISSVLDNPEILSEMSVRTKAVYEKYSWSAMKEQLADIYNNL